MILLFGLVSTRSSLGALGNGTSVPSFSRGRRGTFGTWQDKRGFLFERIGVSLLCVVTVGRLNVL